MSRERFARQLGELREDLLRLGNRVEHAMKQAIRSLETWNTILASQVIYEDTEIDEARHNAEERVITLIATQQPVASDLRLLGAVFAISTELERIGDYASTIARRLQRSAGRALMIDVPHGLLEMASVAQEMLTLSMEAFLRQDVELANRLADYDNRVDGLETHLRDELLALAHADPQRIEAVLDMLDVVHALERVADRSTNIGERVIYLETSMLKELNP